MAARERQRRLTGYAVWSLVATAVAIPEITAAVNGEVPWPTISGMVGHLESMASWVGLIVVGAIVTVAYYAIRYPVVMSEERPADSRPRRARRTASGRLTLSAKPEKDLNPRWFFSVALVATVGGALITVALKPHGKFILGYVLYGLIGTFWILGPNLIALVWAREAPYPPVFRTIHDVEQWWHPFAVLIAIGLGILLLHLALYPWPGIFRVLQPTVHSV